MPRSQPAHLRNVNALEGAKPTLSRFQRYRPLDGNILEIIAKDQISRLNRNGKLDDNQIDVVYNLYFDRNDRDFMPDNHCSDEELVNLISDRIQEVFRSCKIEKNRQEKILSEYASRIAPMDLQDRWASQIRAERHLPSSAPAIWKDDKLRGDTPPVFIKRHYSDYLAFDASGLSQPDIKRLDISLYVALRNWLRNPKHQIPDDCPLPTESQRIDAEIGRLMPETDSSSTARLHRLSQAMRRRDR